MKIDKIEKIVEKLSTIKFAYDPPKNIKECITRAIKGEPTYFRNGTCQCNGGRYRSIRDLYKLSKHYFPNTKLQDVIDHSQTLSSSMFCNETNQTVFTGYGKDRHNNSKLKIKLSKLGAIEIEN